MLRGNAVSEKEKSTDASLQEEGDEIVESGEAVGAEEKDLAQQLEEAKQQLGEYNDKFLRMAADFDNTKKRLAREREISLKYAEENLLKELLPTIDNLERALEQSRDAEDAVGLLEGIEMTLDGLRISLEKFGLVPVDSLGQQFDPNFHEAIAMEVSEESAENMVTKEYQKGYLYKDRLLRAAKVVVSSGPSKDD